MFKGITKVIGRGLSLPHGTYLSCLFRQLGISTHGDTPVTLNQPISYGALHHVGYHFEANTGMWIKRDHLVNNKDEDINAAFEDVPALEPTPPQAFSSHTAQPFFEVNSAILDAILSLSNDV
ncbi:hypothetical protein Goshw_012729 [Gossypium schwendimanii]|uniref:Uncharacterized protein n=1 Tax=Gossypium schwendimanii TaxID=34291 RepID=A0A7J9M3C0_GOSSC|nr:hypothetical protein [Gossypium schwendimanii]